MAIAELVTAEQYLHTSFEHDAEFVDGRIVERPVPTWEHSRIQGYLNRHLEDQGAPLSWFAVAEQRVRTRPDRFRVPDVCLVREKPTWPAGGRIVTVPPYLCVEILSPEDRSVEIFEKVREYIAFGVDWVWIIDPVTRTGQIHGPTGVTAVENQIFFTDRFEIDLAHAEV